MSVTYHHYGVAILNAPVDRLRQDMFAVLNVPHDSVDTTGRATASADAASAELGRSRLSPAMQLGVTTVLEEVINRASGRHTLTYQSAICAPEIAEYVATCSLQRVADAPHTTFVEWMREYRLDAADGDRIHPLVSALVDHDQAIASRFAAEYDSAEVLVIDYTLGSA
jgi:hypothetical protein